MKDSTTAALISIVAITAAAFCALGGSPVLTVLMAYIAGWGGHTSKTDRDWEERLFPWQASQAG